MRRLPPCGLVSVALAGVLAIPGCGEPTVSPTRPYQPPPRSGPAPAEPPHRPAPPAEAPPAPAPVAEVALVRARDPSAETQVELAESTQILWGRNLRITDLYCLAYRPLPASGRPALPSLSDLRVVNAPRSDERYDLRIHIPGGRTDALRAELRAELKRKFGLGGRWEARQVDALVLVRSPRPARGGSEPPGPPGAEGSRAELTGSDLEMLAEQLEERLRLPVVNETGLEIAYKLILNKPLSDSGDARTELPATRQALQKQLGLDLVPGQRTVEYVILERGPG